MTEGAALYADLEREHRRIDELFGAFLAAAQAGDATAAGDAIATFDETLRRHTQTEEERLYPLLSEHRLVASSSETESDRQRRELRLEHVQIREISGMMRRLLAEKQDLAGARALAGNLARRWDAHTTREEREVFR